MNVLRVVHVPPTTPCTDPDGHLPEDVYVRGQAVPTVSLCQRCGQRWGIVTIPEQRRGE